MKVQPPSSQKSVTWCRARSNLSTLTSRTSPLLHVKTWEEDIAKLWTLKSVGVFPHIENQEEVADYANKCITYVNGEYVVYFRFVFKFPNVSWNRITRSWHPTSTWSVTWQDPPSDESPTNQFFSGRRRLNSTTRSQRFPKKGFIYLTSALVSLHPRSFHQSVSSTTVLGVDGMGSVLIIALRLEHPYIRIKFSSWFISAYTPFE